MNQSKLPFTLLSACMATLLLVTIPSAFSLADDPDDTVTPKSLDPHLTYLASPDREGRDDWGKVEARDYIINHFKSQNLKPLFVDGYLQVVPQFGSKQERSPIVGENIGAFVEGTDAKLKQEWIIVNAHYDHLGVRGGKIYPGADDNASGVAMLLEVASLIAATPCRRSVAFVAFDLEEHLLWGSRWFLAHPPMEIDSIKFCLTADMIGRSLGGIKSPIVFALGSERSKQVREALEQIQVPDNLVIAKLGIDIIGVRSDYGAFYYRGIPFLFFSTGTHPDYHTPRDTLEKINVVKTAKISTLIGRVARSIANRTDDILWQATISADIDEVRAVHTVAEHLMKADEDGKFELSDVQRLFISQVIRKTKYMLQQNRISNEERKWLVRATQIMMLSIF